MFALILFFFFFLFLSLIPPPPQIDDADNRGSIPIVLIAAYEAVSVNEISDGMSERIFFSTLLFFPSCKNAISDAVSMKSGVMGRHV